MIFFTSLKCGRCRDIHDVFNIEALDIEEVILTEENAEGLAELAWHGLVEEAGRSLPIIIDDEGRAHTDLAEIVDALASRAKDVLAARLGSFIPGTDSCEGGLCSIDPLFKTSA